jgi:hypothetical protein
LKKSSKTPRKRSPAVIDLEDLAPRKDPRGGAGTAGKTVFGEAPAGPDPVSRSSEGKRVGKLKSRR